MATKTALVSDQDESVRTRWWGYQLYDGWDRAVYTGITSRAADRGRWDDASSVPRMRDHMSRDWWPQVEYSRTVWTSVASGRSLTRAQVEQLWEKPTINNGENPLYNLEFASFRKRRRWRDRWLPRGSGVVVDHRSAAAVDAVLRPVVSDDPGVWLRDFLDSWGVPAVFGLVFVVWLVWGVVYG